MALDLRQGEAITLDHLLCYLETTSPVEIEVHARPQWSLTAVAFVPYVKIARLENLTSDLEDLVDRGLLPLRCATEFPMVNKLNSVPAETMDAASLVRARRIYERDFDEFGYTS